MNNNLLIVGAGIYAVVASEIAKDMGFFENIAFVDDGRAETSTGERVIGKTSDLKDLSATYGNIVVAIGNPEVRLSLLRKIEEETDFRIVSLVSPRAYVAPSAKVSGGCIIEPMAVVHSQCELHRGCIISAGAVVNHATTCEAGVHIDCNATVEGFCVVPEKTKLFTGEVFRKQTP